MMPYIQKNKTRSQETMHNMHTILLLFLTYITLAKTMSYLLLQYAKMCAIVVGHLCFGIVLSILLEYLLCQINKNPADYLKPELHAIFIYRCSNDFD